MTNLLTRDGAGNNRGPAYADQIRTNRFQINDPDVGDEPRNNAGNGVMDNNDRQDPAALFVEAGDHLKHLCSSTFQDAQDALNTQFKAVPTCLFQHIGKCGGIHVLNGFCDVHITKMLNGTLRTKYSLIHQNGKPVESKYTGLVNQEPLVSIDNIGMHTTAVFPVFELMHKEASKKAFTLYTRGQVPLAEEQNWLYKIYHNKLNNDLENFSLSNWLAYMSTFNFPTTGWYFLGPRSLDLGKCTLITQAICSLFQPQATEIGGVTQSTFSGFGLFSEHHIIRNDSLYWEGTQEAKRDGNRFIPATIGPFLIASVIFAKRPTLKFSKLTSELQIAIKYNKVNTTYYKN